MSLDRRCFHLEFKHFRCLRTKRKIGLNSSLEYYKIKTSSTRNRKSPTKFAVFSAERATGCHFRLNKRMLLPSDLPNRQPNNLRLRPSKSLLNDPMDYNFWNRRK